MMKLAHNLPSSPHHVNRGSLLRLHKPLGRPPSSQELALLVLTTFFSKLRVCAAKDVEAIARRAGLPIRQLKVAKARLGIRSRRLRTRAGWGWFWEAPEQGCRKWSATIRRLSTPLRESAPQAALRALPVAAAPSLEASVSEKRTIKTRLGRTAGYWSEVLAPLFRALRCNRETFWRVYNSSAGEGLVKGALEHAIEYRKGMGYVVWWLRHCGARA